MTCLTLTETMIIAEHRKLPRWTLASHGTTDEGSSFQEVLDTNTCTPELFPSSSKSAGNAKICLTNCTKSGRPKFPNSIRFNWLSSPLKGNCQTFGTPNIHPSCDITSCRCQGWDHEAANAGRGHPGSDREAANTRQGHLGWGREGANAGRD